MEPKAGLLAKPPAAGAAQCWGCQPLPFTVSVLGAAAALCQWGQILKKSAWELSREKPQHEGVGRAASI